MNNNSTNRRAWSFVSKHERTVSSARELMEVSGLDWNVSLKDIYAAGSYDTIEIPNRYAVVKTDKNGIESYLSVVGARYNVFQNADLFSSLDKITDAGQARWGAAGELDLGRTVWATLELPGVYSLSHGNDGHTAYVVARTSHDGTKPFQLAPVVQRLSCTNQINLIMNQNGAYSIRHTTNNVVDVNVIAGIFQRIDDDVKHYIDMANWLTGQSFNDESFGRFIKYVYPMPENLRLINPSEMNGHQYRAYNNIMNSRNAATSVWNNTTETQLNITGTKYAAFQAVVEAEDHFSNNHEKQGNKILMNKDSVIKSRALELVKTW